MCAIVRAYVCLCMLVYVCVYECISVENIVIVYLISML